MDDVKLANTPSLRFLNIQARQHGFNRQLSDNCCDSLDPDGWHVLTLVLWGHNADHASILHHRAELLMKFTGEEDPHTALLDITGNDWDKLPKAEDFKKYTDDYPAAME